MVTLRRSSHLSLFLLVSGNFPAERKNPIDLGEHEPGVDLGQGSVRTRVSAGRPGSEVDGQSNGGYDNGLNSRPGESIMTGRGVLNCRVGNYQGWLQRSTEYP